MGFTLLQSSQVVSYRNSTSNHNIYLYEIKELKLYLIEILHQTTTIIAPLFTVRLLYLIEILHQTTTLAASGFTPSPLYLIEILHQTTTLKRFILMLWRCILSKFYIKPQRILRLCGELPVVSYRNSTSNHNRKLHIGELCNVVSYRNSTSNHNRCSRRCVSRPVVSYRNSTSNHN